MFLCCDVILNQKCMHIIEHCDVVRLMSFLLQQTVTFGSWNTWTCGRRCEEGEGEGPPHPTTHPPTPWDGGSSGPDPPQGPLGREPPGRSYGGRPNPAGHGQRFHQSAAVGAAAATAAGHPQLPGRQRAGGLGGPAAAPQVREAVSSL